MTETINDGRGLDRADPLVRWEKWWGPRFDSGDIVKDEFGQKYKIISPQDWGIGRFTGWWYVDKIWDDGKISHRYVRKGSTLELVSPNKPHEARG